MDGYDEIFSEKKQEINRQIELFIDSCPDNNFLITTRPGSGIETFSRFYDFSVCPLNDNDVTGFIAKIISDEERKNRLIKIIKDPANSSYYEYLRNPLLLSMFIMASESHPEIPKRKSAFYRNVFDTLYSRHDGVTKNSFPREKISKLERDNFEVVLSVFSYLTMLDGQYTFTYEYLYDTLGKVKSYTGYSFITDDLITDLRTTISILILDGFEYYFPHRSLQEYFTALFISKLPTNKKAKAYNNLSDILENSSTDYSFNFWSLCFELDENNFIANYLLPQLKKIFNKFRKHEGKDKMVEYIKFINAVLYKESDDDNKILILRHSNYQHSLLDFCNVYDYQSIVHFANNSNISLKLINEFNSKNVQSKMLHIKNEKVIIDILYNHKFIDEVNNMVNALENKIKSWTDKIENNKKNIENLLNL